MEHEIAGEVLYNVSETTGTMLIFHFLGEKSTSIVLHHDKVENVCCIGNGSASHSAAIQLLGTVIHRLTFTIHGDVLRSLVMFAGVTLLFLFTRAKQIFGIYDYFIASLQSSVFSNVFASFQCNVSP